MWIKNTLLAVCVAMSLGANAQGEAVTFTRNDLMLAIGSACGPAAASDKISVHRNGGGNMVYIISEGRAEVILFAATQTCNQLSSDTIDLWRAEGDGRAVAQLARRFDGRRLMIGETDTDGINAQRFDVEASGQYLVRSHGNSSDVSSVDRAYRPLVQIPIDGKRIFTRPNGLLVFGDNQQTGQLEAVPIMFQGSEAIAGAPIIVPGVQAGVQVLDYNASTDEVLLGGLDAMQQTSIVIANLGSGQARLLPNAKPGAEYALFITDPALRNRINGNIAAPSSGSAPTQQVPGQPRERRGIFGLFGR